MKADAGSSWVVALLEARAAGHRVELTADSRVRCSPTPTAGLLDGLTRNRDRIAAYLADEAASLLPKAAELGWRRIGDSWFEDPETGWLYWCDGASEQRDSHTQGSERWHPDPIQ